ncbi:MAG: hypothetical protein GC162_14140 [Planctomycetes bacterium]|nr:hypothetical protein [Planctomycetota bacterium]
MNRLTKLTTSLMFTLSASIASAATLNGQWLLIDAPTGTANDQSSFNDDGTYTGSAFHAAETPDSYSAATDFDQSGGLARVTGLNSAENLRTIINDMTLTAWIKPDAVSGKQRVLSRNATGNGWGFGISGSEILLTTYGAADNTSSAAALVAAGWRHIAVTQASSGAITYYVNGVALTGAGNTDSSIGTQGNAGFGWQISGLNTNELFNGALYDVRAYSGVLSASEIQTLATVPHLVAYYALDEKSGTKAYDSSGYQANGTHTGDAVNAPTVGNASVGPEFGSSYHFNGTNQEVNAHNVDFGNLTSNFTVSAWINPDDTNGIQRIFSSTASTSGTGWGLGLNGDKLRFTAFGKKDYDIAASIQAGVWSFVSVVFDSGFDATFYVNGVNIGTVAGTLAPGVTPDIFRIGNGPGGENFAGYIDEVRVYDIALSQSQIQGLMVIPAPAALPAGLALMGLVTMRRRK